ncbi:fructose-6-phosphate aldolase [bacterium]|nr:fructose-6-phosphate aldolase [bacterium]
MKFFVDTADVGDVKKAKALGLADGVTTNPTLIQKSGQDFKKAIVEIARCIEGPVFTEVTREDTQGIVKEGKEFATWASNVVVKIPITQSGLEATRILESEKIGTALTLIFSPTQALLAAKAGASYICPFVGRLDDISSPGMDLIGQIVTIYSNFPEIQTEIIVASIRTTVHVLESALMGAHGVTIPFKLIEQLARHPLTDSGISRFLEDWKKVR